MKEISHIEYLPPQEDVETKAVLRLLKEAHRYLAELKGIATTIPNENILIDTLTLQEAKDSSAVENIITTHDEMYKERLYSDTFHSPASKEVNRYAQALKKGFMVVREKKMLTNNTIIAIQKQLENNNAGFRKQIGTKLINQQSGQTVYTPPQHPEDVVKLMSNLEQFVNEDDMYNADPLVKMAIIHFQFESIHPFYDGNGRTGRIINMLYIVMKGLLDIPILYLSRYIIRNKETYYKLLQSTRESGEMEEWILFILEGVKQISTETISMVGGINHLMKEYKNVIKSKHKFYSHDLINNMFRHPYTKIDFLMEDLKLSRPTATKYLNEMSMSGLLEKRKIGRSNYYVNEKLVELLTGKSEM